MMGADGRLRAWLRRLGSGASILLVLYAVYRALVGEQQGCGFPKHPKPGAGYACDLSPPTHPHTLLWLLVAAAGVAALVTVRRMLAPEE